MKYANSLIAVQEITYKQFKFVKDALLITIIKYAKQTQKQKPRIVTIELYYKTEVLVDFIILMSCHLVSSFSAEALIRICVTIRV